MTAMKYQLMDSTGGTYLTFLLSQVTDDVGEVLPRDSVLATK